MCSTQMISIHLKYLLRLTGLKIYALIFIGGPLFRYRVSNNGLTTWRPWVPEVQVFSDQSCVTEIEATYVAESGHNDNRDGSLAFDGISATHWRPQCHPCETNVAWLTFSTTQEAQCVTASNLGRNDGGDGQSWNGGILVELLNDERTWSIAMKSNTGNSAVATEGKMV